MAFIGNLVPHRSNTFEHNSALMQQSVMCSSRAALLHCWREGIELWGVGDTVGGVSCHTSLVVGAGRWVGGDLARGHCIGRSSMSSHSPLFATLL